MDRISQEQVIEAHCEQLVKLTERIPGHFNQKDIHQWRVEYKKLRAFLRMITAAVSDHVPHITPDLKKIYAAAGVVREFQVFESDFPTRSNTNWNELPIYHSLLLNHLFAAKEEFVKRTDIFSFEREKARWLIMPPDYLTTDIVQKFVQQRITAIRLILLAPDDDAAFHSIRKHLKDIIYGMRVFTEVWGIPFPVTAWKTDKKLIDATDALGLYNDQCTALSFFEDKYIGELPAEEKNRLLLIKEEWLRQKQSVPPQLIAVIEDLRLSAAVKKI